MKQNELVQDIIKILEKSGFSTSDPTFLTHAGFDLVARRGQLILVIKALANVDSLNKEGLGGMVALSRAVNGSPLLIGAEKKSGGLEDGVVYSRFGLPLLSKNTFHDLFIEEVPPLVYSAPGGFYVRLNQEVLRKLREGGISLGELAEMAGVSRRTIQMYEDGMGAKLSAAIRLETALGTELIMPIDPFSSCVLDEKLAPMIRLEDLTSDALAANIFEHLNEMGYSVEPMSRCPFDALTSDRETVLFTGVGRLEARLLKRAKAVANISALLERHAVFFVEDRGTKTSVGGTPLISHVELEKISEKKKVIELIKDRG